MKAYVGRDGTGKKRYVERTVRGNRRDAERELSRLLVEVDEGLFVASPAMTVDDLLDPWLDVKRAAVEPSTLATTAGTGGDTSGGGADGPALCWVGLNPSTGDTTGAPRPTLNRVVARATDAGLAVVIVVKLFSWRATLPSDLKSAAVDHDIVGERTDEVITRASERAALTLAAWGAHGSLQGRDRAVAGMLHRPVCLGLTKGGQPRNPLYVAARRHCCRTFRDLRRNPATDSVC